MCRTIYSCNFFILYIVVCISESSTSLPLSSSLSLLITTCCCCCWVASVVSDSVRPQRWQPTRLPCSWDSPGKNTGVGCRLFVPCICKPDSVLLYLFVGLFFRFPILVISYRTCLSVFAHRLQFSPAACRISAKAKWSLRITPQTLSGSLTPTSRHETK